jgi:hypothetical protein
MEPTLYPKKTHAQKWRRVLHILKNVSNDVYNSIKTRTKKHRQPKEVCLFKPGFDIEPWCDIEDDTTWSEKNVDGILFICECGQEKGLKSQDSLPESWCKVVAFSGLE